MSHTRSSQTRSWLYTSFFRNTGIALHLTQLLTIPKSSVFWSFWVLVAIHSSFTCFTYTLKPVSTAASALPNLFIYSEALPKSPDHLWWPLAAPGHLMQEIDPLGLLLSTIKTTNDWLPTKVHTGKSGSHKPWFSDPPYPTTSYMLGHENNTPQAQHGYQGLLKKGDSPIWALWVFHLQERMAFPILSSLLNSPGHHSSRLLGCLMSRGG